MNVDPKLAESLMSTFYAGKSTLEHDKLKCESIWRENNNDRAEILKIVVKLCGDVDTPQTRYIKALAWSFNKMEYSNERIESIKLYLNNDLYEKAYINKAFTLEKGKDYGKKVHTGIMLQYLAEAYCHLKDYDNEEMIYKKIFELNTIVPNGNVLLAKFYKKRGKLKQAIEVLNNGKKNKNYQNNSNYKLLVDNYLLEYENKTKGINKHYFDGYDSYQSGFINGKYYPELEKKSMQLREKYKDVFECHREFLENIDFYEYNIKHEPEIEKNKTNFVTYCLSDINLYSKILNYYTELNGIGFSGKYEYSDKGNKEYPIFRKIISYYEKEKKYNDAITLCDIAINNGIYKFFRNISIKDKKESLLKLVK